MSKRTYRPGLPFEDVMELVRWLIVHRRPVYLKRGLDQKWKRKGDLKFMHFGFAASMHLLDLHGMVMRRRILRAMPPMEKDPAVVDAEMPQPQTATAARILEDICPDCHRRMRPAFDAMNHQARFRCNNPNCKNAWWSTKK